MDEIVEGPRGILDLWKLMNISNDRFIRTTDDYHVAAIQKIFRRMYDKGDIYKGTYRGKYCKPCESFWTESQLVDGKCPDCGREVTDAEEEAYFFRLSKYADRVRHLLEDTDFLEPRSRVNEMVNNFIKPGLEDLCVSRTSFSWGIPVDFDPGHVVYVWVDALFNYTTALGFLNDKYNDYEKYWPADVHFVGKEIVRFHSIIWPAMLMSMEMPLPKKVYGHGWLLLDGGKMSKSKGNVVDPYAAGGEVRRGCPAVLPAADLPLRQRRQFLQRAADPDHQHRPGQRSGQSGEPHHRHGGEVLRRHSAHGAAGGRAGVRELRTMASTLRDRYEAEMERFQFQNALDAGVQDHPAGQQVYRRERPLGAGQGSGANRVRLATVLYQPAGDHPHLRHAADALYAGELPRRSSTRSALRRGCRTLGEGQRMGRPAPPTPRSHKGETLFPRIDAEKALAELEELEAAAARRRCPPLEVEPYSGGERGLRHLLQVRFPGGEDQELRGR